jgi:hypothetical protein
VKQADLRVGSEYALPTYEPYGAAPLAARVRVVSVDGGGKVTVQVVDPGAQPPKNAWGAKPVKRNEKRQVTTRNIACPWEEWAHRAASIGARREAVVAEQRSWCEYFEHRRAERVAVDPERALPEDYDEEGDATEDTEERITLSKAYRKVRGLGSYGTYEEIVPLMVDLPIPVLRDILAADRHGHPGAPGTVASVFPRAAMLLENARIASVDRHDRVYGDAPQPGRLLGEADIAFVDAVRGHVAASGGELILPPVPVLPDWVDEEERLLASVFGWLRLAIADTTGQMLHSPACRTVRSRPIQLTDHLPWWKVMLEGRRRVCGVCDGPCMRDLVPLAGFTAAVDVWHYRGRERVERWQQGAFQRLLSATSAARAQVLEPDITLAHRIISALHENAPGDEGWHAYALLVGAERNDLGAEFSQLSVCRQEAARCLARDRLSALEAALSASQRPLPLPQSADVKVLRERRRQLTTMLWEAVPQLDRILFTLPGMR